MLISIYFSENETFLLFLKCKSEHLVVSHKLSLIDLAVCQHCPPGALQVVVGVENVPEGVDGVS